MGDSILEVNNLVKYYPIRSGIFGRLFSKTQLWVKAVDNVSFTVSRNETFGLVGESGSGKTTLGRTLVMLQRPTSGKIIFGGRDITSLKDEELRQVRRKLQIVFQNPYSSLDPRQRGRDILLEPLRAFGYKKDNTHAALSSAIEAVGLPKDILNSFPHQLSGGQRQRLAIARALVLDPEFIVLDEPTSALDASVQAQILNLLRKIQEERGISYIFITHNVDVVKYMADRIAVMYAGKLMEIGPSKSLIQLPFHPYTSALISSVPRMDPEKRQAIRPLKGEVPSAVKPPGGCRFNPRCRYAKPICVVTEPELRQIERERLVACHFAESIRDNSIELNTDTSKTKEVETLI